ncbi:MAG: cytochrome c [Betaproteobacteria bacterium]|nr:cytochrome c [Betaproteobacteria bacterium]
MRRILAVALLTGTLTVVALAQQPKAFSGGDAKAGQMLAEKDCVACHVRKFGDAHTIYTRSERKVRTPEQLLAQVQRCNAELSTNYFPEEETHIAAFLNSKYYKFKP